MKKNSPYKKSLIALIACGVLLTSALIGGISAKYTQQVALSGTGADITLQQVEKETDFALVENTVTAEADGSYVKAEGITDEGVSYFLIPGTTLPKNPVVSVTNKTELPAYLYLVLAGPASTTGEFEYAVDANTWKALDGVANTYVYAPGGTESEFKGGETKTAHILAEDKISVTSLKKLAAKGDMTILCYLVQNMGKENAKDVWNDKSGLVDTTAMLTNKFTVGEVTAQIVESFDGTTKSSVQVKNTGNVPAVVRARLIVNWLDENGNVIANPQGVTDPALNNIDTTKWTKIGDYYYYNGYVAAGDQTANLLKNSITAAGTPAGYQLQIEVVAEAMQATGQMPDGTPAAKAAWGHYYGKDTAGTLKWLPDDYR